MSVCVHHNFIISYATWFNIFFSHSKVMACACKLSSSLLSVKMMIRIDWVYAKQSHDLIWLFPECVQYQKDTCIEQQQQKNTKYCCISFRQSLLFLFLWNWYQFSMKHEINTLNVLVIPSQYRNRSNLSVLVLLFVPMDINNY